MGTQSQWNLYVSKSQWNLYVSEWQGILEQNSQYQECVAVKCEARLKCVNGQHIIGKQNNIQEL